MLYSPHDTISNRRIIKLFIVITRRFNGDNKEQGDEAIHIERDFALRYVS